LLPWGNVILLKTESDPRNNLRRIKVYPNRLLAILRRALTFFIISHRTFDQIFGVFGTDGETLQIQPWSPADRSIFEDLFPYHASIVWLPSATINIKALLDSDQCGNGRPIGRAECWTLSVLDAVVLHNRYKYLLAKARSRAKLNGLCR